MAVTTSYLVCATPRSGSTVLCEELASTGVAGRPQEFFEARRHSGTIRAPREFFDEETVERLRDRLPADHEKAETPDYSRITGIDDYAEHLRRTFARGTTPNGVFGGKLMSMHLEDFVALAGGLPAYRGLDLEHLLDAVFPSPRFIWVSRRDKVRQAISLWRAIQTQAWRRAASDGTAGRIREPVYDKLALERLVRRLSDEDTFWEGFFSRTGIEVLRVVYEDDLAAGTEQAVRRVLRHIGIAVPPGWHPSPLMRRQSDSLSDEWAERFARGREQSDAGLATA